MKYLIAFSIILIYKMIINFIQKLQVLKIQNLYLGWLKRETQNVPLTRYIPKLKKLINNAGIKEQYMPVVRPMGFGQIASMKINILDNFPSNEMDYASATMQLLEEAVGIYQTRMFEGLSPKFWVDLIIFLPKNLIQYMGLNSDTVIAKSFQVFWWLMVPVAVAFRHKIYHFLFVFLSNFK